MSALQVDPGALEAAAQWLKQAALSIDSLRVDLFARCTGIEEAAGDRAAGAAARTFATAADQYLSAARDELAGLVAYGLAVASAAAAADSGSGGH